LSEIAYHLTRYALLPSTSDPVFIIRKDISL